MKEERWQTVSSAGRHGQLPVFFFFTERGRGGSSLLLLATVSRKCLPSACFSAVRKQALLFIVWVRRRGRYCRDREKMKKERKRARGEWSQDSGMCLGKPRVAQPRWLLGNPWQREAGNPAPHLQPSSSLPPSLFPLSPFVSLRAVFVSGTSSSQPVCHEKHYATVEAQ